MEKDWTDMYDFKERDISVLRIIDEETLTSLHACILINNLPQLPSMY
jgi:hypothetical protein